MKLAESDIPAAAAEEFARGIIILEWVTQKNILVIACGGIYRILGVAITYGKDADRFMVSGVFPDYVFGMRLPEYSCLRGYSAYSR